MDIKRLFTLFLYYLILPFSAISFVLNPLTNDSRIFIAAASIADRFYSLPYGWDAAYEVKPIGNRILNWVFYKGANAIVPLESNHYTQFGIVVKVIALLILIVCCWYISRKIVFPYGFPFLFLAFVCQGNFGIMMAEWFSVLFSLVAIALCMENKKHYTFFAGVLMVCVGLLKSITSFMLIPVICTVYLLNSRKVDLVSLIGGCVAASVVFLALCLTVFPYSIGDMLMSRLIAHVGMHNLLTIVSWFWITQDNSGFPRAMLFYIPIILIGIIAAVFVLVRYRADYKRMGIFTAMWFIPIGIVLAQSEFIVYHYVVMMLPAVVTVVLLKNRGFTFAAMGSMFGLFVMINCVFGSFTTYEYSFWHQKELNADSILAKTDLINQSSLLYLDPGDAPYYFHANSSCHYITPMPIERNDKNWDLTYLPQYKDTYNCIVGYQGEYIVSDLKDRRQYFGKGIMENTTIMDMIGRNYTLVDSQSWDIYKKR